MKHIILVTLLVFTIICGLAVTVIGYPYYQYDQFVNKEKFSSWYFISDFSKKLLSPSREIELKDVEISNEELWRNFHLDRIIVPLPVNNPFYSYRPILNYDKKNNSTQVGLSYIASSGEKILDIYFLETTRFNYRFYDQKLFELPIVQKNLPALDLDKIWSDLFSKRIGKWDISYQDMIYNLYLLKLRSINFPKVAKSFGYISNLDLGFLELESADKDYNNELFLIHEGTKINLILIKSSRLNLDAQMIKSYLLQNIKYRESTPRLADIIYKEFRALEYEEQISNIGFTFLLSAWSHDKDREEFLNEAILRLERGKYNKDILSVLLPYMEHRYQKTYRSSQFDDVLLSNELKLQMQIKESEFQEEQKLLEKKFDIPEKKETFEDRIRKAKQNKRKKSDSLFID